MPPRHLTLAIVVLWLTVTGWMVYREVLPRFRPNEPPPFNVDFTDDLSVADGGRGEIRGARFTAEVVNWRLYKQGKLFGSAESKVVRHKDRTFELWARVRFGIPDPDDPNKTIDFVIPVIQFKITSITSSYHITSSGDLLGLKAIVMFTDQKGLFGEVKHEMRLGVEGVVEGDRLLAHLYEYEPDPDSDKKRREWPLPFRPMPVPPRGAVLNTLQPLNRITGLHEGQTWRVPRLDPLETVLAALTPGQSAATHYLNAEVHADTFAWHDKDWPCWRIDYSEPSHRTSARTWVRQRDGLVLQQEARHDKEEMVLRRAH
jgi:hypothetical protein